ncbi:hypothetical protein Cgig2_012476 [Carnegiea gigantea]|uniref:Zinc knuckle CX2CX4HX4C domain-containing protein n=1 Tax=Carnegiea gigantea TaxID=171969 RepID=A0A9Q1QK38_9CARY|nr:hypothetical protein Cgig2_012476 [Carnegiea gigantea]
MASGLEDAWNRLKLTEEEEVEICGEEDVENVWKLAKGLVTQDLDKNLFSFQFFSLADKMFVLNEGPWAFDGHLLLRKEIMGTEQPMNVTFDSARFWVKAYGVPPLKQTSAFAQFIAAQLGTFYACTCDEPNLYCETDKSMNFQVDIDISKPLRREVRMVVKGKSIWIDLGYVKLPDFCYGCGRLGHVLPGYDCVDSKMEEEKLQYGDWLRASLVKSKRRNADAEKLEEKKLFMAFQKKKGCAKGKDQADLPGNLGSKLHTNNRTLVDDATEIPARNEVCKRKKSDCDIPALIDKGKCIGEQVKKSIHAISKAKVAVQSCPQQSVVHASTVGDSAIPGQERTGLRGLLQSVKLSLVFLPKTKLSSMEMRRVSDRVLSIQGRELQGLFVDSRGSSGGLALLWTKEVQVTFAISVTSPY